MTSPTLPLSGRRILVVEDEYLIAIEMERWLQEAGAEVAGPVSDTERALALIETEALDAAVLDVHLNGEPAYVVADRLTERGVPYLFATGEVRIAEGSDYRSHAVLGKPILDEELLRAVSRLIAH
ncbi:MAG TPA: response regulator [Methylobacterium sp.]|jgi:CheY-like chemotaxis protein|uniref:response regulator n=1 Tax=Methylorubrum sp. B1-46 TaxID=2897334 RepID=UPI001E5470F5|nr:response regulator [Methylorubrum sp. B1-46]UGB27310.1 response regulator [Methylorubrum sp. B1-46]HEV2543768.1 response regulator [Methylobacterium sp.]